MPSLWVIDVVYSGAKDLKSLSFTKRMSFFKSFCIDSVPVLAKPHFDSVEMCKAWMQAGPSTSYLALQRMFEPCTLYDGYILVDKNAQVSFGTQYNMYKWKPQETIDLKVRWSGSGTYDILCSETPNKSDLTYVARQVSVLEANVGKKAYRIDFEPRFASMLGDRTEEGSMIVECTVTGSYKRSDHVLFMCRMDRERQDKMYANTEFIVAQALDSQIQIVTEQMIDGALKF